MIYVFQPEITAFSHIGIANPPTFTQSPRSTAGLLSIHYIEQGKPVPEECIPKDLRLSEVDMPMPDFYYFAHCETIVSNEAKSALEELAPGAIDFIEVKIRIATSMKLSDGYFYINVLPAGRRIEWTKTSIPSTKRFVYLTPEGRLNNSGPREQRDIYRANPGMQGVAFRPRNPEDPLLWHELDMDDVHTTDQGYVLMEGDLWRELDRRFPGQLKSWKW